MDVPAKVQTHGANHCIATWHEALIQVWWGVATQDDMATSTRIARTFIEATRTPIGLLLIIEPTSPAPTGKVLDEFTLFSRDIVPRTGAAVAVAEGGGFRSAIVRNVAASLAMVLPKRLPYRFVDTVEAAAVIIAPHLSSAAGGAPGLLRAVKNLRASVAAGPRPR